MCKGELAGEAGKDCRDGCVDKARCLTMFLLATVLLLAFPLSGIVSAAEDGGSEDGNGGGHAQVIVRLEEGSRDRSCVELLSRGARFLKRLPGGEFLLDIPSSLPPESLQELPGVAWAEPDYLFRAAGTPNDPDYPKQWYMEKNAMPEAWDIAGGGSSSVVVAVVDSGVAYRSDGFFSRAPDFQYTSFVPGYDFVSNDAYPDDEYGHGTHVAAIIASSFNNAFRAAGMSYRCSIMPVRVLSADGLGTASAVASGIRYAADHGARVICLSLASPRHSETVGEAVRYAYSKGVTCVAAAGNEGSDPGYPGGMDCPADEGEYIIAVGATDYRDQRAHYSNYGMGLDLVAPGGDLTRDDNGDGYGDGIPQESYRTAGNPQSGFSLVWGEGTSMAAPQVAAAAALLLSLDPKLVPMEINYLLTSTCRELGSPGWDPHYGHGMLQVAAALHGLQQYKWYFAEGTTREGFEEWLCVLNPSGEDIYVRFTFLLKDGGEDVRGFLVPPVSRFTLNVNDAIGPGKDVSAVVQSNRFIVAERAMYYDYHGGWQGGECAVGATSPSTLWYFAEGTTREGFEEWLTLANPNGNTAVAKVEFFPGPGQGGAIERTVYVPPRARETLFVNEAVGAGKDVSLRVTTNGVPVVAERPMYFYYGASAWGGGSCVFGHDPNKYEAACSREVP